MSKKTRQLILLLRLRELLKELAEECEEDEQFNELIAQHDIVSRSIEEIVLDLKLYE